MSLTIKMLTDGEIIMHDKSEYSTNLYPVE